MFVSSATRLAIIPARPAFPSPALTRPTPARTARGRSGLWARQMTRVYAARMATKCSAKFAHKPLSSGGCPGTAAASCTGFIVFWFETRAWFCWAISAW